MNTRVFRFFSYQLIICFLNVFLFAGSNMRCYAQPPKSGDTAKSNIIAKLIGKAEGLAFHGKLDSCRLVYDDALKKSISMSYCAGAVGALCGIGFIYLNKGDYAKSIDYFSQARPYCKQSDDTKDSAICDNDIGLANFYMGNYQKASECYFAALRELKNADSLETATGVNVYNNLAILYGALGENAKAMPYVTIGEKISRKKKYNYHLAMSLSNKAEFYKRLSNQKDSILACLNEVLELGEKNNYVQVVCCALGNIGEEYLAVSEYQKAVPYSQRARAMAKNKYADLYVAATTNLANEWRHLGKYNAAISILDSLLKTAAHENHRDEIIPVYALLRDLYDTTGQYKKALDCMDTLVALKDTLLNAEKTRAINELETKYKTAEKDKEISGNRLLIEQQKNRLTKKNEWAIGSVSCVLLVTLTLGGLYRRSRHKQFVLVQQVKSLEQENKIEVLKAIMSGEENERKRLARELHDGIGGMVSSAMMQYTSLHHDNERITEIPAYNDILKLLDEIGEEVRKTAHNLMPEVLLKQPLQEALRSYCNYMEKKGALKINFHSQGIFDQIPEDMKLNVYRIVQELLKNVSVHAHATSVLVQLNMHEQMLTITVEDNGTGFNVQEVKNGMGLDNLQARVLSLDGHYSIASEPGKGTSVYVEIPNA
jgi:signal transduction histidine kinase